MDDPNTLDTLGKRIKYWRERCGFHNQRDFATLINIGQSSLSALENGNTADPSSSVLLTISKLLNLSPYYLLYGHVETDEETITRIMEDLDTVDKQYLIDLAARLKTSRRKIW